MACYTLKAAWRREAVASSILRYSEASALVNKARATASAATVRRGARRHAARRSPVVAIRRSPGAYSNVVRLIVFDRYIHHHAFRLASNRPVLSSRSVRSTVAMVLPNTSKPSRLRWWWQDNV